MKTTIMIVLGGLFFAGTSLAAEPQTAPVGSSVKVGIDAKTGKRRQLTSEESAALDAQAAKMSANSRTARAKGGLPIPATYAESVAGGVSKDGMSGYLAPLESMSSLTATVDATGKVTLLENGQPVQQEKEMASE